MIKIINVMNLTLTSFFCIASVEKKKTITSATISHLPRTFFVHRSPYICSYLCSLYLFVQTTIQTQRSSGIRKVVKTLCSTFESVIGNHLFTRLQLATQWICFLYKKRKARGKDIQIWLYPQSLDIELDFISKTFVCFCWLYKC